MPFPPIETARLTLRCIAPGDAARLASGVTPSVSRWLASWPYPTSVRAMQERIRSTRSRALTGDCLPCVIVRRDDQAVIGWSVLARDSHDPRRGALGYWLMEAAQGRGFAREAVGGLIRAGFERLALDVVEAGAQRENVASFAVMRACGMTEVEERIVYAPARDRDEACLFYEIRAAGYWRKTRALPWTRSRLALRIQ